MSPHTKAEVKDAADTPIGLLKELNRLLVRAGRRAAYDLKHAAGTQQDPREGELYEKRANMWLGVFNPDDGGKDYRDRLHHEIFRLETQVSLYRKWFETNSIPDPHPEDLF